MDDINFNNFHIALVLTGATESPKFTEALVFIVTRSAVFDLWA